MTKYKVQVGQTITEFSNQNDADVFAAANSSSVQSFDEPAVVNTVLADVTPRQIRQALILSGISLAGIDAALASLPEPTKSLAKAEWEYSISFQRNRPLVNQMGQMLGWTSAQLDALWQFAGTL